MKNHWMQRFHTFLILLGLAAGHFVVWVYLIFWHMSLSMTRWDTGMPTSPTLRERLLRRVILVLELPLGPLRQRIGPGWLEPVLMVLNSFLWAAALYVLAAWLCKRWTATVAVPKHGT